MAQMEKERREIADTEFFFSTVASSRPLIVLPLVAV